MHDPDYLRALRAVDWRGADDRARAGRRPGLPADSPLWAGIVDVRLRGRARRDRRGRADRRRRALHLRPLAAPRPPRGPGLVRRLLLPEHRRGGGAGAVRAAAWGRWRSSTSTSTSRPAPRRSWRRLQEVSLGSLHASTLAEVPWREVAAAASASASSSSTSAPDADPICRRSAMLEEFAANRSSARALARL